MESLAVEQAKAAASALRELLGADTQAVYLYGSATMWGLKPSSDLDLFAVTARPTSDAEKLALAEHLRPLSREGERPKDWRPLELTIVAEPDIKPWRHPAVRDFQYGEWLRESLDAGIARLGPVPDADVALLISMARQFGEPIFGPPASAMLPEIPDRDLFAALEQTMKDVRPGLRTIPQFALLTLARVWFTFETGRFTSKDDAGLWAAGRLGPATGSLLRRAARNYSGLGDNRWDVSDVEVTAAAGDLLMAIRGYERSDSDSPPAPPP